MTHSSSGASLTSALGDKPLALLGCGKMGLAMLEGWLAAGVPGAALLVIEPAPSEALRRRAAETGMTLIGAEGIDAGRGPVGALILAVKPQIMAEALPSATALLGPESVTLSIAAGLPLSFFEAAAPEGAAIVRAMPNTPAAIGRGITALIANAATGAAQRALAEALAAVVGRTEWLEDEAQMDAVTAVSGSGPAYVFHMIEALAAAGEAEGLAPDLALRLARATVEGAGALSAASPESPAALRAAVTSPGGTTAAGLGPLMDEADGLTPLMRRAVSAAAARSRELGRG